MYSTDYDSGVKDDNIINIMMRKTKCATMFLSIVPAGER